MLKPKPKAAGTEEMLLIATRVTIVEADRFDRLVEKLNYESRSALLRDLIMAEMEAQRV